jgi:hypothetical protein
MGKNLLKEGKPVDVGIPVDVENLMCVGNPVDVRKIWLCAKNLSMWGKPDYVGKTCICGENL